jgi:CRISPR-associated Csx10 family RAMP protein
METYRLDLTLESPLSVSRDRSASNRQATATVVPPQTLRGALAAAAERAGADPETLDRLFGEEGLRTSALLPSDPDGALPAVAPLTLRTCKRHGGFDGDEGGRQTEAPHGVEDTLFASLRLALHDDPGALRALRTCQANGCGHVMTRKDGLVRTEEGDYRTQSMPGKRTQTHVGLDRRRDGAASGMLYAREVVNEKTTAGEGLRPTTCRAAITGPESALEHLRDALDATEALRIGTAVSRGLGRCSVERLAPGTAPPPLEDRIADFNDAYRKHGHVGGTLIALTLRTPALFVGEFLRPDTTPGGDRLLQAARSDEQAHAHALESLERVHEVARGYQFQAWNGLAGVPHGTDQGLRAGSVLVYQASEVTDELLDALSHVEKAGVGLRRELGLGRVRVCDRIHTDIHEHTDSN